MIFKVFSYLSNSVIPLKVNGNQTNLHTFINYFRIYHLAKGSILRLRNELLIQARFLNAVVYSDHRKRR